MHPAIIIGTVHSFWRSYGAVPQKAFLLAHWRVFSSVDLLPPDTAAAAAAAAAADDDVSGDDPRLSRVALPPDTAADDARWNR